MSIVMQITNTCFNVDIPGHRLRGMDFNAIRTRTVAQVSLKALVT